MLCCRSRGLWVEEANSGEASGHRGAIWTHVHALWNSGESLRLALLDLFHRLPLFCHGTDMEIDPETMGIPQSK